MADDATSVELVFEHSMLRGTLALTIPPGTVAVARDRLIDDALTDPLFALAEGEGVVLAADPHVYAHPREGKDDMGRTVFDVEGHAEGDRLHPIRHGKRRPKRR